MARHMILILAVAASFLSLAALSATALAPYPAPDSTSIKKAQGTHGYHTLHKRDQRPPEPYPGFYALVEKCLEKLSGVCGREIFTSILGDGSYVSNRCCFSLVEMGRRCHRNILKATLALPQFSKRKRKDIMNRDAKVWEECVLVSNGYRFGPDKHRRTHQSPSPSP